VLNWLLVFLPITVALEYLSPDSHTLIFLSAAISIIPLAGWLGHATEHIASRVGEGLGGLLNASLGNAAELIIAIVALHNGLYGVVKASLTGSIIGNILLVLGASILAGGLKFKFQKFNAVAARTQSTLLTLALVALVMPFAFHYLAKTSAAELARREGSLSLEISVILLISYGLSLLFMLHTHKRLFAGDADLEAVVEEAADHHKPWSMGKSLGVLAAATALIAWMSEILVGSVSHAAETFGMTQVFVGVIVVAIVGNAAEHSTAILVAMKNRMDLSLSIAIGSSVQIALFVAPLLVILSRFIGPRPMDLIFTPAEVLAIALSVIITEQITGDGESNWLEGVLLLAVYLILGIVFYFLPEVQPTAGAGLPH
jgi:Ca2+:H+ antiporter